MDIYSTVSSFHAIRGERKGDVSTIRVLDTLCIGQQNCFWNEPTTVSCSLLNTIKVLILHAENEDLTTPVVQKRAQKWVSVKPFAIQCTGM